MAWYDALSSIGSVVSGLLGIGTSAYGSSISSETAKEINEANLAYAKEYNQQVFDREDTSYQRAVADAQAAGLSPLVAAGVSAGDSGGVASAPQSDISQASIKMQGYQGVANAFQSLQQLSSQAALTQSQANLNNANADKARKETDNIDFEQGFKMSQLTQQQKEHIDNMAHNKEVLEQTNRLAKQSADLQRELKKADLDWEKVKQMNDRELQEWLANADERTKLKIIQISAQTEQATLRIANVLNKDRDAASQQLAYDLENQIYTDIGWFKDGPQWLSSFGNFLQTIVKIVDTLAK